MDYSQVSRPYDAVMNRIPGGTSPVITNTNDIFNQPAAASSATLQTTAPPDSSDLSMTGMPSPTGVVATNTVNSPASVSSTTVSSTLQSATYKPNARGFQIDGTSGNAQFAALTINSMSGTDPATGKGMSLSAGYQGFQFSVAGNTPEEFILYPGYTLLLSPGPINQQEYLLSGAGGSLFQEGVDIFAPTQSPGLYLFNYYTGKSSSYTADGFTAANATYENLTVSGTLTTSSISFGSFSQSLLPSVDTDYNLGSATKRWYNLYVYNNPIVSSDARGKENIINLNHGLDTVLKMRPVTFNRKEDTKTQVGFIAQEMKEIIPEVVHGNEEEGYGLSYEQLVPVLVKAVQDLTARVQELEKRVT